MSNTTRATRFLISMATLSASMFGAMNIAQAGEVNNNLHQGQGQGQSPAVHAPATAQPQPAAPSKPATTPVHMPAPAPAAHPGQGQPAAPSKPAPQPAPAPQPTPAQTQGQGQGQSQAQQTQVQLGQQTGVVTEVDTKTTVQTGVDVNAVGKGGNAQGGTASQGQSSVNDNSSGAASTGNTTKVEANDNSSHKTTYYNPGQTVLPSNYINTQGQSQYNYRGSVCGVETGNFSLSTGVDHSKVRSAGFNTIFGGLAYSSADTKYTIADEFKPVARTITTWTALQTGTGINPYVTGNSAATASQLIYMSSIESEKPSDKDMAIVHGLGSIQYKAMECGGQSIPPVVVTPPDHGGTTGVPQGQEGKDNKG
jgi:hypothetical protein